MLQHSRKISATGAQRGGCSCKILTVINDAVAKGGHSKASVLNGSNQMEHFGQLPVVIFVGMMVFFALVLGTVAIADARNG